MNYYQMIMNSEQASLIARALDFWDRCHGGQLGELSKINIYANSDQEIKALKKVLFPDLDPFESKFSFKYAKEAFNLRKLIEHAVSWTERPLKNNEFPSVNYDGPMEGWWETEPAQILALKDGEFKRVKGRNHFQLTKELTELLGTSDLEDGVEMIKELKKKACQCE